jgi:hypothetical protein
MKIITGLCLMAGIFISCQTGGNHREESITNHNTLLLENLMGLWETGDTSRTREIFTENCVSADMADNQTLAGIAGARLQT